MKDRILTLLLILGMLMLVVGIALPLLSMDSSGTVFRYIYSIGALAVLAARLFTSHDDEPLRVKRLHRIEVWSALFYCAAAFFMFYEPGVFGNIIALTLAGAVIQAYASIMIPIAEKKSQK